MKVLAFAATNSRDSINRKLVEHAAQLIQTDTDDGVETEILDLNDYEMPLYSVDREAASGIPTEAQRFYQKIGEADALVISFAEHNGNYTAAYKNLFDWASRISMKVFQGKPTVIMAASPGPGGGATVLNLAETSAPYFGADIRGKLSVGSFSEQFDVAENRLTNEDLTSSLLESIRSLVTPVADYA